MKFLLGTHMPNWIWSYDFRNIPLFVSRRTLARIKRPLEAETNWNLDSGGFSELQMFGEWRTTPQQYVKEIRRYQNTIGRLDWAAPQDWMCEPFILAKTGLSVERHQQLTINNYLEFKNLAPELPIIPVIQGYTEGDYRKHIDSYLSAGIDLTEEPIVGIGSVCRRQHTSEIHNLIKTVHDLGIKLHGFGVKTKGLEAISSYLESSDSMAWSFAARRELPLPWCSGHKNCANCREYALIWRKYLIQTVPHLE